MTSVALARGLDGGCPQFPPNMKTAAQPELV
jgi:hypothetical protein